MRIHEFGTEHEKTVLLLHSACLSWRMFQPAAERLQTQYHLIIPALPAHDPDEKTASCIYTQKGNKKIRKPQAANQTALIFDRRAAARLLSINSIRRLCWS